MRLRYSLVHPNWRLRHTRVLWTRQKCRWYSERKYMRMTTRTADLGLHAGVPIACFDARYVALPSTVASQSFHLSFRRPYVQDFPYLHHKTHLTPFLLPLLPLGRLLLLLLRRHTARFRAHDRIPPPETTAVVAQKLLVMYIMMISTCPEGQHMMQRPWELVPRVRINSLEQPQNDPDVHCQNMQIFCDRREDDRYADRPKRQNHNLNRARILRS